MHLVIYRQPPSSPVIAQACDARPGRSFCAPGLVLLHKELRLQLQSQRGERAPGPDATVVLDPPLLGTKQFQLTTFCNKYVLGKLALAVNFPKVPP